MTAKPRHTPLCPCVVTSTMHIEFCPVHAAAPAMREALADSVDTIERLYDHLKAKAGDIDLVYALRTLNRNRAALRLAEGD